MFSKEDIEIAGMLVAIMSAMTVLVYAFEYY